MEHYIEFVLMRLLDKLEKREPRGQPQDLSPAQIVQAIKDNNTHAQILFQRRLCRIQIWIGIAHISIALLGGIALMLQILLQLRELFF